MRFVKSFYRVDVTVKTPQFDFGGYVEPFDFYSLSACQDHISASGLDINWPEGQGLPITTGECSPQCFCEIYRRHILRDITRFKLIRASRLAWYGFERMRRSVAAAGLTDRGFHLFPRHHELYYVPRGYYFSTLLYFAKSFRVLYTVT